MNRGTTSAPRWGIVTLLCACAAAGAAAGCETKSYSFVDVPFCVAATTGATSAPERKHIILYKYRGGWGIEPLSQSIGGPSSLSAILSKKILLAVVSCEREDQSFYDARKIVEEFSPGTVPRLCLNQKTVFHGTLEAVPDPRAEALGHGGYFHFPPVDLGCVNGKTLQENDRTLGQILRDFVLSVQAYMGKNKGQPPPSLAALEKATLLPPLPTDPWGHPLVYRVSAGAVELVSSGKDGTPDTPDDEVACSVAENRSTSILSFRDAGIFPDDDYRAAVKAGAR
jgi:hypothetical protein